MIIRAHGLGKKFDHHWIFRDIDLELAAGDSLSITGPNGSGKSTLLQILIGALSPSRGKIEHLVENEVRPFEEIRSHISLATPYTELIEEYTLTEHLDFHARFRKPLISLEEIIQRMGYPDAAHRPIAQFSSGMKQRTRLALAFYFQSEVIALDEPTSNLDEKGIEWYQKEMEEIIATRSAIVSSNQRYEYGFCRNNISLNLNR